MPKQKSQAVVKQQPQKKQPSAVKKVVQEDFLNAPFGFDRIAFMKNMVALSELIGKVQELEGLGVPIDRSNIIRIVNEILHLLHLFPFRHGLKSVASASSDLGDFRNKFLISFLDAMHDRLSKSIDLPSLRNEIVTGCKELVRLLIKTQMSERVVVAPSHQICLVLTGEQCLAVATASKADHVEAVLKYNEKLIDLQTKFEKSEKAYRKSQGTVRCLMMKDQEMVELTKMLPALSPQTFFQAQYDKRPIWSLIWEYCGDEENEKVVKYQKQAAEDNEKQAKNKQALVVTRKAEEAVLTRNRQYLEVLAKKADAKVCTQIMTYPVTDEFKLQFDQLKQMHELNLRNERKLDRYIASLSKLTHPEAIMHRLCNIHTWLYDFGGAKGALKKTDFTQFRTLIAHLPDFEPNDVETILQIVERRKDELRNLGLALLNELKAQPGLGVATSGFFAGLEKFRDLPFKTTEEQASVKDLAKFLENARRFYEELDSGAGLKEVAENEKNIILDSRFCKMGQALSWFDDDRVKDWKEHVELMKKFDEQKLMQFREIASSFRNYRNGRIHTLTAEDRVSGDLMSSEVHGFFAAIDFDAFKDNLQHMCAKIQEYSRRPPSPDTPKNTVFGAKGP